MSILYPTSRACSLCQVTITFRSDKLAEFSGIRLNWYCLLVFVGHESSHYLPSNDSSNSYYVAVSSF